MGCKGSSVLQRSLLLLLSLEKENQLWKYQKTLEDITKQ